MIGAQQNCVGFASGVFVDGNPGPRHRNFNEALAWFGERFRSTNIEGGYQILYWPKYGDLEDSHWAARFLNGHWVEKIGATDIIEWDSINNLIADVRRRTVRYSTRYIIKFVLVRINFTF